MIKFKDYKYERPDLESLSKRFETLIEEFKDAENVEAQNEVIRKINKIRNNIETMASLVSIRHSIDTRDEFYEKENNFIDENSPKFSELTSKFYKELVNSEFREELEKTWGSQVFDLADLELETFSPEIMEDLVKENKLVTEYNKLIASAKLDFQGKIRNLSDMRPFLESKDRSVRKEASETLWSFFEDNEEEFDRIYDELVKVRDKMAKTLGFKNYVEMGYKRLGRSDYDAEMVKNYRDQVLEDLVPVVNELGDRQAKRLGMEAMKYYDEPLEYTSGNATPKGDEEWILDHGNTMYRELSPETDRFFSFMRDKELLDLMSKEGKMAGGYCTIIPDYESPFIFSNFNGTSGDIDVLTHEAGHAFQVFMSMGFELPEYKFPTLEACEIHSMSMEFLTWPWMELFFEDEVDKYKFSHLAGAISFIPYGVSVDEFQHFVYENPDASPDERKSKWREIEKKYLPSRDYEENDFLNSGTYWFKQGHIFSSPFYYIDYTLAQVCAFQFWIKNQEDKKQAWEDYLRLCKAGGSKSFLDLVDLAKLDNPFVDGTIKRTVGPLKEWLDGIDDSKF
nr:M3 family oligoendopeptidase [Tissierella sp.]